MYFHFRAEFCLKADISAAINPLAGNHRWEITDSVIGKSIKHRDHFEQVLAALWGVLLGE